LRSFQKGNCLYSEEERGGRTLIPIVASYVKRKGGGKGLRDLGRKKKRCFGWGGEVSLLFNRGGRGGGTTAAEYIDSGP